MRGFFDVISRSLIQEKIVKVKGLGTFKLIDVLDRESIDVNTGERIVIGGQTVSSMISTISSKRSLSILGS